jgi:Domain of unknown function (DUF4412)
MKIFISILLITIMATDAFGEVGMPDEYQADSIGSLAFGKGHEVFYVSGKNTRWQNGPGDDAARIYISNAKENVTYKIDVPSKVYKVIPYQPRIIDDSLIKRAQKEDKDKEARLELIGTETVDGQFCDHFRLTTLTTTSYHSKYDYWVSKIYGVPIKIILSTGNTSTNQNDHSQNELFIKPGHQSPDLFVLPAGYKREEIVAFATVGSKSIHSQELTGRPKAIQTALCEDQKLHKIRYVERHLAKPDCDEPSCRHDESFDRFEFVENPLTEGMCLIGDDDYFRGKSILKFSDNVFPENSVQRPLCDSDLKNALERARGLAIKGCWRLGKFGKTGSFNITEFVERNAVRAAALSLYDGKRLVLKDWTVKIPTKFAPDVWRLGDEGVLHPEENFVLFGLRSGSEIELATVGYGGEGINYYLNRTDGNAFMEMLHEYVYTAGY